MNTINANSKKQTSFCMAFTLNFRLFAFHPNFFRVLIFIYSLFQALVLPYFFLGFTLIYHPTYLSVLIAAALLRSKGAPAIVLYFGLYDATLKHTSIWAKLTQTMGFNEKTTGTKNFWNRSNPRGRVSGELDTWGGFDTAVFKATYNIKAS